MSRDATVLGIQIVFQALLIGLAVTSDNPAPYAAGVLVVGAMAMFELLVRDND